jgi:hypothetical protein
MHHISENFKDTFLVQNYIAYYLTSGDIKNWIDDNISNPEQYFYIVNYFVFRRCFYFEDGNIKVKRIRSYCFEFMY